jgi:hypothetical protein
MDTSKVWVSGLKNKINMLDVGNLICIKVLGL